MPDHGDFAEAPYPWHLLRPNQPPIEVKAECAELRTSTYWPVRSAANTIFMADERGTAICGVAPKCSPTITVGSMDDVVIIDDDVVYRVKLYGQTQPAMWDYVMISAGLDGSVEPLVAPAAPGTYYACGIVVDYNPAAGGICHIVPVFHAIDASITTAPY